ncbi:MAG: hypothetical protein AB7F31_00065 [Parachlamydiales bacterium]
MSVIDLERKALYNSLRIHARPHEVLGTYRVEEWQVEDYRSLSMEALFDRLAHHGITLDPHAFVRLAEEWDTPEEMLDDLLPDQISAKVADQIYLPLFELWRRLVPEKQSLSIFCDELDHQILEYDRDPTQNGETMADMLANLQEVLDENSDEGADPQEVFALLQAHCASDLERFLYDYIASQVDEERFDYAAELYEGFAHYHSDPKWLDLLHIRTIAPSDPEEAEDQLQELLDDEEIEPDLDFDFEILSHLCQVGSVDQFRQLLPEMVPMLKTEEDFQDLLGACAHYFQCLDWDEEEQAMKEISQRREARAAGSPFTFQDPDAQTLLELARDL